MRVFLVNALVELADSGITTFAVKAESEIEAISLIGDCEFIYQVIEVDMGSQGVFLVSE